MKAIGAIISFVCWLAKLLIGKREQPQNQYQRAKYENAKAVTDGDVSTVNRKLNDLTDNGV